MAGALNCVAAYKEMCRRTIAARQAENDIGGRCDLDRRTSLYQIFKATRIAGRSHESIARGEHSFGDIAAQPTGTASYQARP
jgi:hypothetical protein